MSEHFIRTVMSCSQDADMLAPRVQSRFSPRSSETPRLRGEARLGPPTHDQPYSRFWAQGEHRVHPALLRGVQTKIHAAHDFGHDQANLRLRGLYPDALPRAGTEW